ncbi:MAG: DegT/DnrJ/EryC1/StrS aminotransferase family protein [Bacteroidales bacterium]|nr:DegT/DnrJ/EryC1/StrS aminotransferase family protein [Bacteroidales bacterium]
MFHSSFTCNSLIIHDLFKLAVLRLKYAKSRGNDLFITSLKDFFGVDRSKLFLFGAARMGLYSLLKTLKNNTEEDEVIVAGFTCVVVTNAIKFAGFRAVYVDVNENTLNISTEKIKEAVTGKTRAIIVTHNFGVVYENIDEIKKLYPDIVIIEDAAHTFSSTDNRGRKVGLIGDASFFSFEYSKPLTTGMGGLLIVNEPKLAIRLKNYYETLPEYGAKVKLRIFKTLAIHLITSGYFAFLKGAFIRILKIMGLLFRTDAAEMYGEMPDHYPVKMSGLFALIGFIQMKKIDKISELKSKIVADYQRHVGEIANIKTYYEKDFNYVRYPILFEKHVSAEVIANIRAELSSHKVMVGVWFNDVVHPRGSYRYCYNEGQCPVGESVSKRIINLPVNVNCIPSVKQLETIKEILSKNLE